VEKVPENPRAWMSLGYAAMVEGNLEESVRIYQRALEVDAATRGRRRDQSKPIRLQILRNLGGSQVLLGRYAEAEATLREAVAIGPDEADVLNNLAAALESVGRLDEAEVFARRASLVSPMESEGWATLGAIRLRRGDAAAALPFLDRAVELAPDVPMRHYNRAVALLRLGRREEACGVLLSLDPGTDPALAPRLAELLRGPACALPR